MNRDDTFIMVCAHKPDVFLSHPPYVPIHVGKAIASVEIPGTIGDDTGDNISERNPWYCELTAQYWAWKNLPESVKYVGLSHYRRYFDFTDRFPRVRKRKICQTDFFATRHPVPDPEKLFERYDVVIAQPNVLPRSIYREYCNRHIEEHLLTAREVLAEKYPDYLADFDRTIFRGNRFSAANMVFMPRARFDAYSEWLFDILLQTERRIVIPEDPYQRRVMGFISERLLRVWIRHNHLRVSHKTLLLVKSGERSGAMKQLLRAIRSRAASVKNDLLFALRSKKIPTECSPAK